jgi:rubrerythrin
MSLLRTHLNSTKRLIEQAETINMPVMLLAKHARLIEKQIKQAECIHNPKPTVFNNATSTGIVWVCSKCNKITDIETNPKKPCM